MNDKEIYECVEEEIERMILDTYHGICIKTDIKSKAMVFARRAIRKTIDYKNSQNNKNE